MNGEERDVVEGQATRTVPRVGDLKVGQGLAFQERSWKG